jgi:hypothetical protein
MFTGAFQKKAGSAPVKNKGLSKPGKAFVPVLFSASRACLFFTLLKIDLLKRRA